MPFCCKHGYCTILLCFGNLGQHDLQNQRVCVFSAQHPTSWIVGTVNSHNTTTYVSYDALSMFIRMKIGEQYSSMSFYKFSTGSVVAFMDGNL